MTNLDTASLRHLSRSVRVIAAALVLAAGSVLATSATPARASGVEVFTLIVNSGKTALGANSQGHNKPLDIIRTSKGVSLWDLTNWQNWKDPLNHKTYRVAELQEGPGNKLCIAVQSLGVEYMVEYCHKGAANELFLPDPTGSKTHGQPNYWYISVSGTDDSGVYDYMTANRLRPGSRVFNEPAGQGGRAAWEQDCFLNC
jgi:hypothetical protein